MWCILKPPAQQRPLVQGYRLHVSHNQLELAQQNAGLLEPKKRAADDKFFAQNCGCVFSNRNAPGSAELRADMDLSLEELGEQGQGRDMFPSCALFALWSALQMRHFLPRDIFEISMGLLQSSPKFVDMPDPCCEPNAAEL
jgi:hypothetical protein